MMKCKQCGGYLKKGIIFCSLSCSSKYHGNVIRQKVINEYNKNPNKCNRCGVDIVCLGGRLGDTKNKKFCSTSCSATFSNAKREVKRTGSAIKKCIHCGVNFNRNGLGGKFCSQKCCGEYSKIQTHNKYKKLIIDGFYGEIKTNHSKLVLIELRGYKCEICSNVEWNGNPIPIELHHIDGDYKNNILSNMKLICPNCHTFTDNYKSKNKGSTRER